MRQRQRQRHLMVNLFDVVVQTAWLPWRQSERQCFIKSRSDVRDDILALCVSTQVSTYLSLRFKFLTRLRVVGLAGSSILLRLCGPDAA
jgi:hypothetical protein